MIIAWLISEDRLSAVIRRSRLHGEWLDGIHVSSAGPDDMPDLQAVMSYLKNAGLKLEVFSDGPKRYPGNYPGKRPGLPCNR